jgi:hypothetical protein
MKKILLPSLLFALVFLGGHIAFAQTATGNPDTGTKVAGSADGTAGGGAGSANFVPLTNLPIFGNSSSLTSAPSLPAFFNALYVYCVGIAAALAVLQLIHAGILYMGGDSITEVKQAKDLIGSALFGLLLVLSPVIIFGLINPKILNLNVGFDKLQVSAPASTATTPVAGSLQDPNNPLTATANAICKGYSNTQWSQVPNGKECSESLGGGWTSLKDNVCCTGAQPTGATCCGFDKNYVAPKPPPSSTQFNYSIAYQDIDYGTSPSSACLAYNDAGDFPTVTACETAMENILMSARSRSQPYAVAHSCTDNNNHQPTGAGWAILQKLHGCPRQ